MRNKLLAASLCLAAVTLLGAGRLVAPPKADIVDVTIKNLGFNPDPVNIKVGQTVRWTNKDDRDYSLLAKDQSFKSGNLRPKETFEFKFTEAGSFDYFDVMRPRVMGTVVVAEKN